MLRCFSFLQLWILQIKTSESQFSVIPAEELEDVMTTYNSASSGGTVNHNHTSKSTANGSIITMTMKNNHLIVETEERVLVIYKICPFCLDKHFNCWEIYLRAF